MAERQGRQQANEEKHQTEAEGAACVRMADGAHGLSGVNYW